MTLSADACLDPALMRALLQQRLPGCAEGRWSIDALDVRHARRSTSRHRNPWPIVVCYELSLSDRSSGARCRRSLYAKLLRDGAQPALEGPAPLLHASDLGLVIWTLPDDPGLPQLSALLDKQRVAALLPAMLGLGRIERIDLLRHEPEQRATLRYTFGGIGTSVELYAKTFADERGAAISERFAHFWQRAAIDRSAPLVAQPLGYAARTLWQAQAPGLPISAQLGGEHGPALIRAAARALAQLHAAPLCSESRRGPEHWIAEAQQRKKKIARALPRLTEQAAAVAAAIEARAAQLAPPRLGLIHGDFHIEQVGWHAGRVVLFDFDEFTLGDPMEDLAEFVSKLDRLSLPPQQIETLGAHFVDAYRRCDGTRFDAGWYGWHLALQQLLLASRAFVFQKPGWPTALQRHLARAEAQLHGGPEA